MHSKASLIVFSDLDETLLRPGTNEVDGASALQLDRLCGRKIRIVLCSSRTRAELELIQQALGIADPFVCENGAAVYVPRGYFGVDLPDTRVAAGYQVIEFGHRYERVVETLHRIAERLRLEVIGFSDMSVEEVAQDCGLSLLQARLAKLREYDEPFRIQHGEPAARARLCKALRAAGFGCTSRGRYDHAGAAVQYDAGVELLCAMYRRAFGPMLTIGLADNANDVTLLRRVDIPLILQSGIPGVTARLLTAVPSARLATADRLARWIDTILDTAEAADHREPPSSH